MRSCRARRQETHHERARRVRFGSRRRFPKESGVAKADLSQGVYPPFPGWDLGTTHASWS